MNKQEFAKDLYSSLSMKIVNEDIMKHANIEEVVIKAFSNSQKVFLLGYETIQTKQSEMFSLDLEDHLYKVKLHKMEEKEKEQLLKSMLAVNMSANFYTLRLYLALNKNAVKDVSIHNTIYKMNTIPALRDRIIDNPMSRYLLSIPFDPTKIDGGEDLIKVVDIFIPYDEQNTYNINGIRYYPTYFSSSFVNDDIKIEFGDGKYLILTKSNSDNTGLRLKIYDKFYSIYDVIPHKNPRTQYSHCFDDNGQPTNVFAANILHVYNTYKAAEDTDDVLVDIPPHLIENVLNDISSSENDDIKYSLIDHKDLYRSVNEYIRSVLNVIKLDTSVVMDGMFGFKKTKQAADVMKRIRFKPNMVLSSIIESKQYISSDSVNEIDGINLMRFTSNLHADNVSVKARRFKRDQLGIYDPLNTPLNNIGVAGGLCPSISSDHIKHRGLNIKYIERI